MKLIIYFVSINEHLQKQIVSLTCHAVDIICVQEENSFQQSPLLWDDGQEEQAGLQLQPHT